MGDGGDKFLQAVLASLKQQTLPDYVTASLDDAAEQVAACATVVVEAEFSDDAPSTIGASKVGGQPDLPADVEWPREGDEPLAFVAQLNFAEVREADVNQRLPSKGMLWLFSIADGDRAYGYEIDDGTTALIWRPEPGELATRQTPEAEGELELEARGLRFGPSLCLVAPPDDDDDDDDDEPRGPEEKRFDGSIERAITAAIRASGGASGPLRLLGPAFFYKEENIEAYDMDVEDVLVWLDGYATATHAFGEGSFTWLISRGALAEGALERSNVVFEVGS